ncbi:unnamed protein product [marine sediment metagenome]|uniref:Uncharacterized protein n=1 Tax=marine sediment metagenome TaxID=412755 RepID=X1MG15_9ZZZZ
MSVAKQLYQLQEVELELESNEQAVSQIANQLGKNQAVVRAQNELTLEHQRLEELTRQQHSAEWEIEDLVNKLAPAEEAGSRAIKTLGSTASTPGSLMRQSGLILS